MQDLLFLLLLVVLIISSVGYFSIVLRHENAIKPTFLASFIVLVWMVPRLYAAINSDPYAYSGLLGLLFLLITSLIALQVGWVIGVRRHGSIARRRNARPVRYSETRLVLASYAVTIFAAVMTLIILSMPAEVRVQGQWTGPITIIAMFSQTRYLAVTLAILLFARKRTASRAILLVLSMSLIFPQVFLLFRRADTFILLFSLLAVIYTQTRKRIPRIAFILAPIVAFFFINGVGELRRVSGGYAINEFTGELETRIPTLQDLREIRWENIVTVEKFEQRSEILNGAYDIQAASLFISPVPGAQWWNRFVHAYFPGQIIGHKNKDALAIGRFSELSELVYSQEAYDRIPGQTSTGLVAAYADFRLAGFLIYFLIGYGVAFIYSRSRSDDFYLVLFCLSGSYVIHSFTHHSYYLFVNSIHIVLAAIIIFSFSRIPRRLPSRSVSRRSSAFRQRPDLTSPVA